MSQHRVISAAEFERARIAFVTTWDAVNHQATPRCPIPHTSGETCATCAAGTQLQPGERSSAGLMAALQQLGIIVATDEALRIIERAAADAPRILGGSNG